MPLATTNNIDASRAGHWPLTTMTALPSLRQLLQQERQRRIERAVAATLRRLDHPGVSEDYRTACRFGR